MDTIFHDTTHFKIDTLLHDTVSVKANTIAPPELHEVLRVPLIDDWTLVIIIISFIILGTIFTTSGKYLTFIISSIFNRQTALRLFRERVFTIIHPAFRLDLIYFLSLGIYFLHFEKFFFELYIFAQPVAILLNAFWAFIFIYGKFFLYSASGFLFNSQMDTNEYLFYAKTSSRVLGLFLLPLSIIMFFTDDILTILLLILGGVFILFLSAINIYRGFQIIARKDFSISYLILYLCTLEILPILIVWRILSEL